MCDHCGCRGVAPVGRLMAEHDRLLDLATDIRAALDHGDAPGAWSGLGALAGQLLPHVRREERGLFAALRLQGEFAAEVAALEDEHASLDELLSDLDLHSPDFGDRVRSMLDELATHIERENLGVFPVAVVTLSASGWGLVDEAHRDVDPGAEGPATFGTLGGMDPVFRL